MKNENFFILLNKPFNISSSKYINNLRKQYDKIGHSGTLDPYATGLLVIAVNKATKFFQFLPKIKEYYFDIDFGYRTNTDDLQGIIIEQNNIYPKIEDINEVIPKFIGKIIQKPSKFSAIKVNGIRAYKLARNNIIFQMKEKEVNIYELELLNFEKKSAKLRVVCSEGVYVRTLAANICKNINILGCVTALHRTMNHSFRLKEESEQVELNCFQNFYDSVNISNIDIQKLKNGMKLHSNLYFSDFNEEKIYCLLNEKSKFLGLILKKNSQIVNLCLI